MNHIAVIGAGTMGNGIAHVCAMNGYMVSLFDLNREMLEKAVHSIGGNLDRMIKKGLLSEEQKEMTLSNISIFTKMEDSTIEQADLAIEAATENEEVKFKIFSSLDKTLAPNAILASNTSSISITKIASATKRPEKVIGMHFMNPVPIMKLVEIIRGYSTSDQTTQTIVNLSQKLGKIPVLANDYPGFVANRILMPMINEAIYSLFEGVAGVAEIDSIMKLGMAHPMGPLQLADFIGLDVCLSILKVLHNGFGNPKYAPCPLLVNMVAAGQLGMKTGQGFYFYETGNKDLIVAKNFIK
ncbi:MAG: 3-hydroxybutyryl-CoA dehydrogenase [Sphingobacteriales bacterium]|nr:MAG: 3-hydroxybutyryl-CoA dehydrogenase [Sphingobacteriales bacterium]